jgi:hypothetical protein
MIELLRIIACLIKLIASARQDLADLKLKFAELEELTLSHFRDDPPLP